MSFGLRCCWPACRPHPASLPVRVPTVESLLRASFSFTSRLRLALHYGCPHRPRLTSLLQLDSAHAGHTSGRVAGVLARPPSHTTGHAVFRIRRLNPAALGHRKIGWHEKAVAFERSVSQDSIQGHGHSPRTSATVRDLQRLGMHSQLPHRTFPASGFMPPLPETFPDMSTYPRFQFEDWPALLGQPVVPPPTSHQAAPTVTELIARDTSPRIPHLSHLCLESR